MDTQTGAATGLFGLSLDTLKLSIADYTQLCGLWVGRVQFLSDRYLQDSGDAHPAWHAFPVPPDHVELLQALIRNGEALSSHIAAGSHWAVLCAGTKRLEALRSAFAAAPENQRSLLIRKLAADLDHRLKLSAEVKWLGFVPPLYRRALAFIWLNCPAEALIAEILKLPVLLPTSAHFPCQDVNLVEITDAAWDAVADDADDPAVAGSAGPCRAPESASARAALDHLRGGCFTALAGSGRSEPLPAGVGSREPGTGAGGNRPTRRRHSLQPDDAVAARAGTHATLAL